MKLIMLGSGTSTGVPRIGDDWGDCDPNEPRNRRTRVSIIVESNDGKRLLVDTSTDLRQQFLDNNIDRIDGVFWTHDHADHCHGIDDLRVLRFDRKAPIPGFGSDETVRRLRMRFDYIFAGQHGYPTICSIDTLDRVRMCAGFGVEWCQMPHGPTESTAFRFDADGKSVVYATDFSDITPEMVAMMSGTDILVSDCLKRRKHPTHANLEMAIELGKRTQAKKTVLSHLDKTMDYATLVDEIPDTVVVGYDGLELVA